MIVKVTGTGTSFKGAAAYYLHDKDADTAERVAWTHTENLATDDPDKAWKMMAYTAMHQADLKRAAGVKATGRKLQQPVLTMAVSWHEDEVPDQAHMLETAQEAVASLDLSHHEAIYIAHKDEKHAHVHVLLNRVDPNHGKAAKLSFSKRRLQAWALEYEKQQGHIRCPQRLANAEERERNTQKAKQDRKQVKYRDQVIRQAWERSDSGKAFVAALEDEGYHLAQGNKRLVVVDRYGKAHNPTRHLEGVRVKQFRQRLSDLDLSKLPDASAVQKKTTNQHKAQYAREVQASRKFDKWSTLTRNETQDRQRAERQKLKDKQYHEIRQKKLDMIDHYKLRQQRAQIHRLRDDLQNPTFMQKITGKINQERDRLRGLVLNYRSAIGRAKEQVAAVELRQVEAAEQLKQRHEKERDRVRKLIAERKPSFYREADGKAQSRSGTQTNRRSRMPNENDGRELGRG